MGTSAAATAFQDCRISYIAMATMSEAKKRLRKDSHEVLPMRGGKAAASDPKGVGDAPALGKAMSVAPPLPAALRHVTVARVGAAVAAAMSATALSAAAASPVRHQPADQAKQPSATSFINMLRGELRKRQIEVPSRFAADDMSMQAVVHLAETLYVDDILKQTSGNVSLAGKIAKIT
jgi:hypothetical protein